MERVRKGHRPASRMRGQFIFGLDYGYSPDYTARVVVERKGQSPATYAVRDIARYELQTPYQAVAQDIARRYESPPVRRFERHLVVDATGVGRPAIEMLLEQGLTPIPVTITGGYDVTRGQGPAGIEYRVPKRDLAMTVQALLQAGRLQIGASLPFADELRSELMAFRVKLTKSGHDTYEAWRERDHDDLVLALAVATWWAEYELVDVDEDLGPRPEPRLLADFNNF